jgi:hypothetical protein
LNILPDPAALLDELTTLDGGVTDTSTLIYLDKIQLLHRAGKDMQLLLPPDVVREFGRLPEGCVVCGQPSAGGADQAVIQLAGELNLPVFSEDRQLLLSACSKKLHYYNTLMLLLALVVQEKIDIGAYRQYLGRLRKISRYSAAVRQVGEDVFSLFVR